MNATIVIVAETVRAGGAERVLSYLANHWADAHAVSVVSFDRTDVRPFFDLHPSVSFIPLGAARLPIRARSPLSAFCALQQIVRLRRALGGAARAANGPCFVVSVCTYYNLVGLLASAGLPFHRIVTEHAPPSADSLVLTALRSVLYGFADRVVVLTDSSMRALPARIRRKIEVIPNPAVDLTEGRPAPGSRRLSVLGVGRLVREKRFDLFIDAFARVAADFPGWDLRLAGDGPLRPDLERRIRTLGLAGRATILGLRDDMGAVYADASLFVLSSASEGFPLALCEAMAAGLPVISTDCESGPSDIIRDGVDGFLTATGDVAALSDAMRRLMGDAALRASLGRSARGVTERFGLRSYCDRWGLLLDRCAMSVC